MAEPFTLYKLIILYMLNQVDFPLTNSQISAFLLERDYTNYFTLQQAFAELEDAGLVNTQTIRNTTFRHQITGKNEQGNGDQDKRIQARVHGSENKACVTNQGRISYGCGKRGTQQRNADGKA